MRPQSILMFERLFLASLAVSAVSFVLGFSRLAQDPTVQGAGLGTGFILGVAAASYALYLLFWYLVAHRALNWAKWVVVVLVAISLVSLPGALSSLTRAFDFQVLLNLAVLALEVAAVGYLFRADAKAWLSGKRPIDPTVFE
jgi:hypothetical protein